MAQRIEDYKYIVGIDMGSQSTSIGYLNQGNLKPTILDISGGYKDASIPTVMQYIKHDKTWLIGDAAKQNIDMEATVYVDQLLKHIEVKETIIIDDNTYSYDQLLGEYLYQLLGHFKHINPKAIIVKVVIAINEIAYESIELIIEELKKHIQVEDVIIIKDQMAIGRFLQYNTLLKDQTIHILDYGYRALKHYVGDYEGDTLYIKHIADYEELGCYKIESMIKELLLDLYRTEKHIDVIDEISRVHIEQMLFQYYVWFFQKMHEGRPLKVFFNFAFPPFKATVNVEKMNKLMASFIAGYNHAAEPVIQASQYFLMGNGFRMSWTKSAFNQKEIPREYSDVIVRGAVVEGGKELIGLKNLEVYEEKKTNYAYGILVGEQDDQFVELIGIDVPYKTYSQPVGLIVKQDMDSRLNWDIQIVRYNPLAMEVLSAYKVIKRISLREMKDFVELTEQPIRRISLRLHIDENGQVDTLIEPLPL